MLDALAGDETAADAELVAALLAFAPRLDPGELADRAGIGPGRVRAALTQLGTGGKVGYDTAEAAFFHRELPYDAARVNAMNPRLRAARRLAEEGGVRLLSSEAAEVTGDTGVYRVRLETWSCTCPWWTGHRGGRGPCKHVLAVRFHIREEN